MTKDELIAKQQLEIEDYKVQLVANKKIKREIRNKFISIGKPLNDNILHFNKDQLKWCFQVVDLVEQLNCL
jgi:hypothetical protein